MPVLSFSPASILEKSIVFLYIYLKWTQTRQNDTDRTGTGSTTLVLSHVLLQILYGTIVKKWHDLGRLGDIQSRFLTCKFFVIYFIYLLLLYLHF
jgi:hypothetical protein